MRIAIASGKGGAGKTTITACLASLWDRECIVVDADVEAPNLHLFLHPQLDQGQTVSLDVPALDKARCTKCGLCRDICSYKAIARMGSGIMLFPDMCHGCGGCFEVCAFGALTPQQRELGQLFTGTIRKGQTRFLMGRTRIGEAMTPPLLRAQDKALTVMLEDAPADVLMDAPPGVSCPAMAVARQVDLVLLVAEPTPFGFHDFKLAHAAFGQLGTPVAVVMNRAGMAGNAGGDARLRDYCHAEHLPLLAELPFERAAAESYAHGRLPVVEYPAWAERFNRLRAALQALGEHCHA